MSYSKLSNSYRTAKRQSQNLYDYSSHVLKLTGSIFAFVGLIFAIIAIFLGVSSNNKVNSCTQSTIGTVTELKTNSDSEYDSYMPVVSYSANGNDVLQGTGVYKSPCNYYVDQEVEIMYNPDDVTVFYIVGDDTYSLISTIFGIIGGSFVVLGIVIIIAGFKFSKKNKLTNQQTQSNMSDQNQNNQNDYFNGDDSFISK